MAVLAAAAILLGHAPPGGRAAPSWTANVTTESRASSQAAEVANEDTWRLIRSTPLQFASSVIYSPVDGLTYVGERDGPLGRQDLRLLRIHADNSLSMIANGGNIDALVLDPDDGDIFIADSTSGTIFRTGHMATGRTAWVSGFAPGDDDPTGMAIAPHDYAGPVIEPGAALVVDHGYAGTPPGIWRWSPDTPEGEEALHVDDGSLVRPVDVAISTDAIYILDNRSHTGRDPSLVFRMHGPNNYVPIVTSEPIMHATSIAVEPLSGHLWLAEATNGRILRIDPTTGRVTTVLSGFEFYYSNWANIDFTPDGSRLIVSDRGLGRVSLFSREPDESNAPPDPVDTCPALADARPLTDRDMQPATLHADGKQDHWAFDVDTPFSRIRVSLSHGDEDLRLFVRRACTDQRTPGTGSSIGSGSGRHIGDSLVAEVNAGLRTGQYVATVYARAGAASRDRPYQIGLELDAIDPEVTQTLILSGAERMADVWSLHAESPEWKRWQEDLATFAARPGVGGLIVGDVQYETDYDVEVAYKRWIDDAKDPLHANQLVRAIRAWIDNVVDALPNIRYVVLIGDDRVIPHYRLPIVADSELETGWLRESAYPALSSLNPTSAIATALQRDYTLTDDAYAARRPIVWRDAQRVWVPELAVGRLVERPSDVSAVLRAFIDRDGKLPVERSLAAGYDFMQDGVEAADAAMELVGLPLIRRSRLFGDRLRASDLATALLATRRDLAFIGAHATHGQMDLPGSTILGADEVRGALANIDGTIAFGMACHAGLNVPGADHGQPLDFAEAWQRRGASWIGVTGWAYGMDGFLGYQEALLADFARRLASPNGVRLGDALVDSKRAYFLAHEASPMHVKTIAATVLYGLPMFEVRFEVPLEPPVTTSATRLRSNADTDGIVDESRHRNAHRTDQLTSAQLHIESFTFAYGSSNLTRRQLPGVPGDFFTFGTGRPRAAAGEPVQPRELRLLGPIDRDRVVYQPSGILLLGGRYRDVADFIPLVLPAGIIGHRPRAVLGLNQGSTFSVPGWYPRIPIQLRRLAGWRDRPTQVAIQTTVGQYNATSQTERLIETVDVELLYTSLSDTLGPVVSDVVIVDADGMTKVALRATDTSRVIRAIVAYAPGDTYWKSVELDEQSPGVWSGTWPAAQTYFIQVVDGAGNVTTVDDTGRVSRPCVEPCDETTWHGIHGSVVWLPMVAR